MHFQPRARIRFSWIVLGVVLSIVLAGGLAGGPGTLRATFSKQPSPSIHDAFAVPPAPSSAPILAAPAAPGFQWTNISTSHMPPPRLSGAMVYDSEDHYVLLFGGEAENGGPLIWLNDTWTFSGGVWTNITNPAHAPSGRLGFGLADDPADHEVVLFGGSSKTTSYLNDTWTYSAGVWTNISPIHSPPRMFWGAMAYNNQTSSVLLFGGNTGGAPSQEYTNQTWEFHAGTWTNVTTTIAPPGRDGATMVYDAADSSMLLFGGLGPVDYYNDTWQYSSGTWSQVTTSGAPSARSGPGMAYDPDLSKVVVFGGSSGTDTTYTYVGGTWASYNLVPTPPQTTTWGQMTYDYADHYLVLFDKDPFTDSNTTWKLNVTSGPPPPPLEVTASATPQSGTVPLQVAFSSEISGGMPPYTVTWNFDDSTANSNAGNTSHTYEAAGKYDASLTVTDEASDRVVKNWTITVAASALTLTIAASPTSVHVNQTVSFAATPGGGTPPYTYAWTFGDGGTSALQNPTHAYSTVGQFTAQLVLHDSAGASLTKNVVVNVSAGPSSTTSNSDWWIIVVGIVGAVIVIIIAIIVVLAARRRKREAAPSSPNPPTPPPGPPVP
jgi:PKD repeat protein